MGETLYLSWAGKEIKISTIGAPARVEELPGDDGPENSAQQNRMALRPKGTSYDRDDGTSSRPGADRTTVKGSCHRIVHEVAF